MSSTEKIDLFKLHKDQYIAKTKPQFVEIHEAKYLAISSKGEPGGKEFEAKIGALYGVAYTTKMTRKFAGKQDYTISKLECQWWLDGERQDFASTDQKQWNFRFLIRTPDFVQDNELETAVETLLKKGKEPEIRQVKLESFAENLCVQMLHVGPYENEPETIQLMEDFAGQQDMEFHGRHHEIYISDPRRVLPERLKTILRHPVKKKAP